jgi:hypothetical protein
MKSFFLGLAILISLNVLAQQPVKFNQTKHSFGKVKQNIPASTSLLLPILQLNLLLLKLLLQVVVAPA